METIIRDAASEEKLYERVAIGSTLRECHLSGKAFQQFAELDGLPQRAKSCGACRHRSLAWSRQMADSIARAMTGMAAG